ncbi:MAG: hypothetical protein K2I80_00655 [Ruminococcus sp.]|nr:hypothetical protein [Ruminococcus sp.]MDE6848896.1 hypothetical protein [Ruminococcus sp.]
MKRKTRTITVNDRKYVWWYEIGDSTAVLFLSPKNDKTSTVKIIFKDSSCITENQFVLSVIIKKDNAEKCVTVVEPAMAGFVLPYLQEQGTFTPRKHIVIDGLELLEKMGYAVVGIKEGLYW